MPNYDFKHLSPYDFETLVRDLLQQELKITLESFTSGRDKGIDLRYTRDPHGTLIVQCKHFANSTLSMLKSHLKREVVKVARLKPARYLVATSLGLTPDYKKEIRQIFTPFILDEGDIYGRDDLNNLLGKFSEIEKIHFKLWLTSVAVLEKLLHSRIYNQTAGRLEEIERKAKLYVPTVSFARAHQILQEHHVCIIAGIPGIGKSMLADILLITYIDQNFEPIVISSDVGEGDEAFKPNDKQIFYYDDFLGQASHADKKLNKNEDARLLSFVRRVASTKNKRFVLTTREYILIDARMRYEKLAEIGTNLNTCVIALSDYTVLQRAKILYNHLYFSSMERATRNAVVEGRRYLDVIRHRNYNPRLIESIVDMGLRNKLNPAAFLGFMLKTLEEPTKLWSHAFEHQLSPAARAVLVALVSLSFEVDLEDLREAFNALAIAFDGHPPRANDFQQALRVLEDTFIKTERVSSRHLAAFHNPSIRDFMLAALNSEPEYVHHIIDHCVFFDQTAALWRYACETTDWRARKLKYAGIAQAVISRREALFDALARTLQSRCTTLRTYNTKFGKQKVKEGTTLERLIALMLDVVEGTNLGGEKRAWLDDQLRALAEHWRKHRGSKADAVSLFEGKGRAESLPPECLGALRDWCQADLDTADDLKTLLELRDAVPTCFSDEEMDSVRDTFDEIADGELRWVLQDADDAGSAEQAIDSLKSLARSLNVELSYDEHEVRSRIDDLSTRGGEEEDYDPDRAREDARERVDEERTIDSLFGSLSEDDDREGDSVDS